MSDTENKDELSDADKARLYLEEHKIPQIFQRLLTHLLINMDDDKAKNPKQMMINYLEQNKNLENEPILNDKDIETMYQMLQNPVYKGLIKPKQIIATLNIMGINHKGFIDYNKDQYTLNEFKEIINNIIKDV